MQTPATTLTAPRRRPFRSFVLTVFLMAAAFAAGYVPQWLELRRMRETLQTTQLELKLANLHRYLGVASQEAQRNNFANAATAARTFFEGCRQLATDEQFANEPRTRGAITAYAQYADDVARQLATADPLVKERLASLYLTMDGVLARRE